MTLGAATDAIKWTDEVTAWSTAIQAASVVVGIIASGLFVRWQILESRLAAASRETDLVFDRLREPAALEAIDRISQHLDPRLDMRRIADDLSLPEEDHWRIQCEKDIELLTNIFERIWDKYRRNLLVRERYLDSHDELTLYIWHSLSQAYQFYDQVDYEPLRRLAQECRDNYKISPVDKNEQLLNIPISPNRTKRFSRDRKLKAAGTDLSRP